MIVLTMNGSLFTLLLICFVLMTNGFNASEDIYYELYTNDQPLTHFHNLLSINNDNSRSLPTAVSPFNHTRPTRFYVHGFRSKRKNFLTYAETYRSKGDFNFIAVNWLAGSQTLNYYKARHRVQTIAVELALLIENLVQYNHLDLRDVILIGHSLGSHIVGIAAKRIQSGRIPIIVGLDPAYPLFSKSKHEERLARTDADYVQVIHTSIGQLSIPYPIGHADFYPNYGSNQSGCSKNTYQGFCSHKRAHHLFLESLQRNCFLATKCGSYDEIKNKNCTSSGPDVMMGGEVNQLLAAKEGIYYLPTHSESPYGMNCPIMTHSNDGSILS
ncbi:hypothetical protein HA402_001853 [Bradysia odoriphaga]|nr:hypothetical protein HA402_001853 [Bradysia odoriphaga]